MALNFFLQIKNLAKNDPQAAEILEQLKKAQTDEEKESAKEIAKKYIANQSSSTSDPVVSETDCMDSEQTGTTDAETNAKADPQDLCGSTPESTEPEATQPEEAEKGSLTDLSAPAFNPRLAKCGVTREEELFLHGVFVRKMTREEKMEMRRSIYQKKTVRNAKIQAEYKKKRIEQKQKDASDPEKIKFHQERKLVSAIVDALNNNKNVGYIFSNIDGLTLEVFLELIEKPGIFNAIRLANPNFIDNVKKKYGI